MSNGDTQYIVLHETGMNTDKEYRAYRQLMDEYGLPHAPFRSVSQSDGTEYLQRDATCVWSDESEARAFAEELSRRTHTIWVVRERTA